MAALMTIPTWPSELPRPSRAGYQRQALDPRLARSTETGPPGYRRRYSAVAETVELVVTLTRLQRSVFDLFHRDLGHGSLPFWMPDPTTDGWPMLTADGTPLLTAEGTPMLLSAQWLCLFGSSQPIETVQGVEFVKSFSVVVMP
ncbi:hypothetical protein [Frigidibacter oleivorans]|uniref:hypothetical protein n=1 Tax=Frigidibacter oleivorans TaxID=2487129 RepID=UPI001F343F60|nr:hypothetical protein [Frigidibacter oleivorans]